MRRLIIDKLNAKQRENIITLCAVCGQTEPIKLSLPLPSPGKRLADERFFLLYDKGQLMSVIHLFYPDGIAGELIGFTHPNFRSNGYFKQLLSLAADYAEEIGLEQVYVISDGNSPDADKALAALGLEAEYAEYMLGKSLGIPPVQGSPSTIPSDSFSVNGSDSAALSNTAVCTATRISVQETSATLLTAGLFAEIFQADIAQCEAYLEEISSDSRIHTCVLDLAGKPIGQTQLTFMGDMAYLSGFGILPEYRRQGFGLMFLNELEMLLKKQSITQLTLQVSSQNKTALSLYRKDGFETLEALHYYPLFEEE
ncbi:MAG: GNAT family N-acetyltransferase [Lachnospiraceae bacterium]|nr:GNAT family N-acetyltransferase [Lachnospiraceae bacterium]